MPKYYVDDCIKKLIIARDSKVDAARAFLDYYQGRGIMVGQYITVSETGFSNITDTDGIFEADDLLQPKRKDEN